MNPEPSSFSENPIPPSNDWEAEGEVAGGLPGIAGYEVVREVVRGSFGAAYEARQREPNRLVMLKAFSTESLGKQRSLLTARAEVVAAIEHPCVAALYEAIESEGRLVLACEWPAGGTLEDRIRSEVRLTPRGSASVLERIARGVAAIHQRQIVFRDLHPLDILLDADGEPKVRAEPRITDSAPDLLTGRAVSSAYLAPECFSEPDGFLAPTADVWSLGVILYRCLTGRLPFGRSGETTLSDSIRTERPISPGQLVPELPRDLERVCLKCLEKSPAQRYPTPSALAEDLALFLAGRPVGIRPPGPVVGLLKWVRNNKILTLVIALVVLVSGSTAVVSLSRSRQAEQRAQVAEETLAAEKEAAGQVEAARLLAEQQYTTERKRADEVAAAQRDANRRGQELTGAVITLLEQVLTRDDALPQAPAAAANLRTVLALCKEIVATTDTPAATRLRLSSLLVRGGELLENRGQLVEAEGLYRESVELVRSIHVSMPADRAAIAQLSESLSHRGLVLTALEKPSEALPLLQAAVKLEQTAMAAAPASERVHWRVNYCLRLEALAGVLRTLGRRSEAEAVLRDAVDIAPDVDLLRTVAGAYALLAASVPEPGTPEERQERENYRKSAIVTLRAAVDGGWKSKSGRIFRKSTAGDADFRTLLDDPEVKQLLTRAAEKP